MDLKEAVVRAKEIANSVFSDENPTAINLEQVDFDDMSKQWHVVLSFERFRHASTVGAALANMAGGTRAYKLFKLDNVSGNVDSIEVWRINE